MNSTEQQPQEPQEPQPQEPQQPLKSHEPGFWDFHNKNKLP